jgi:hypothetical protein
LEVLGFAWKALGEAWEEGFSKLEIFKAREGHCLVPQYVMEDGFKIGQWVSVQRQRKDEIPIHRRQRLEALGFVWDTFAEAWEEGFSKLEIFKAREGHCLVPKSFLEDGYKLGHWVGEQRKKKDQIPAHRRHRLEALGFVWNTLSEAWEEGFSKLEIFKAREGHCLVPARFEENSHKLGQWVGTQRKNKAQMSADRRHRLDAIGFVWSAK